jgi:outer membrane protein assembly factor BamD (BamD/ComL family)
MAFDGGSFGEALVWFKIYMDERPGGALSREAEGRIVEALQRSGNRLGAREAAKRYLARYPDGPHAELARSLSEP